MTKNKYKRIRYCWVCSSRGDTKKKADMYIHLYTLSRQSEVFNGLGVGRMQFVCLDHFQFAMHELTQYYKRCAEQGIYWNQLDLK